MNEVIASPPIIIIENQKPLDALEEARVVGNTVITVRHLRRGVYTDIPYQKDTSLLRHTYRLEIGDQTLLIVEPLQENEPTSGVLTEEGAVLPGNAKITIELGTSSPDGRRLVGLTSSPEIDVTFLHSILIVE